MSAEGNLYNPAIFEPLSNGKGQAYYKSLPDYIRTAIDAVPAPLDPQLHTAGHPDTLWTARRYLAIVKALKTQTSYSAIKSHLFKLLRAPFEHEKFHPIRNELGAVGGGMKDDRLHDYNQVLDKLDNMLKVSVVHRAITVSRESSNEAHNA